jgi:3-deoxy-D-manno-octulosonic acid (KDO) 8-phosphate synthase
MGLRAGECRAERRKILGLQSSRHTFPVVFDQTQDSQTRYAVDAIGGGRSSAIIRKMSANRPRGMATSASWKAT